MPIMISGIGGQKFMGWQHQISIRIGNEILKVPLVFLEGNDASPRILGREGIFRHFIVVFEEKARRTGFIGGDKKEAGVIHKVLNEI